MRREARAWEAGSGGVLSAGCLLDTKTFLRGGLFFPLDHHCVSFSRAGTMALAPVSPGRGAYQGHRRRSVFDE